MCSVFLSACVCMLAFTQIFISCRRHQHKHVLFLFCVSCLAVCKDVEMFFCVSTCTQIFVRSRRHQHDERSVPFVAFRSFALTLLQRRASNAAAD